MLAVEGASEGAVWEKSEGPFDDAGGRPSASRAGKAVDDYPLGPEGDDGLRADMVS